METEFEKLEADALKLTPGEQTVLAQRLLASAFRRLRLSVHDRGTRCRRAVQTALHPHRGEQLLSRTDPTEPAVSRWITACNCRSRTLTRRNSVATVSITLPSRRVWAARQSGCKNKRKSIRRSSRRRNGWRSSR